MSSTSSFDLLPLVTQKIIDKAFNRYGTCSSPPDAASYPQASSSQTRGGFIPHFPIPSLGNGGGFFVEDDSPNFSQECFHMTLENIPDALQFLGLPPEDDQVLSVFRNAASGWSSASIESVKEATDGNSVSREDWRAVCAVLLEHRQEEYKDDSDEAEIDSHDAGLEEFEEVESDEYLEGEEDLDSDSDYPATAKPGTRGQRQVSPSDPNPNKVTPGERERCFEAFSLFFPEVLPGDMTKQRIMIKDIQRVSKLMGAQLKAEEIIEMLEAFSSSPDKSVDFEDFVRIMIAAKLV